MVNAIKKFFKSDDGAVTVDWVVLTAAVVALAGAAMLSIQGSSDNLGEGTGDYMSSRDAGNF
ncbi:hypothetical protein JQV27_00315 [Sulfitobacter mediterraneus]|jgi:hypothetical protein|uniref:hypothetical protein n=1 Tax=Sulfitobacter TaxID=60136 RepID=UPI00193363CD|nr:MULTISPECIES: hypothetical protein [Sulfitobacter]MBM1631265.1 hypothetical protein [Sulfitobacter mediterraneus]MBM1639078.1 hypothetical protein [Sulfitobacter mediterraneus]MBM1643127.1 hypothetical protein [Sulfitobacter mediterraneus]MBM1647175.1 hypothetical protein [Sulfitobacter mediterraneus]MBM1651218.1 hypothetical protein [Sulfitobacter mediterraneus]